MTEIFRLKENLVIPAGTIVDYGPSSSTYYTPHVEVIISHGKDSTSHWRMDRDEALELGLIEEYKDEDSSN